MSTPTILHGDCRDVLAGMPADSIDAVVTDPPYGLEFMGKDWDRLDGGLPQEGVWKGRRGNGGGDIGQDDSKPSSRHHVSYGVKQHGFRRCTVCEKREFSGSPCTCDAPAWRLEYRQAAPSSAIRMQRWHEEWAREAYRVLKPGGHLLAFGGTRTYHRMACAIEDAGFEIRDCIMWVYGQGFPKSYNVSKAIDKAAGARREVVATGPDRWTGKGVVMNWNGRDVEHGLATGDPVEITGSPVTEEAKRWEGWGTALKPAYEPIIVARKPLAGTVAQNVLQHGTGAINIDGCRILAEDPAGYDAPGDRGHAENRNRQMTGFRMTCGSAHGLGRWPANMMLDESAAAALDEQTGTLTSGGTPARRNADKFRTAYGDFKGQEAEEGIGRSSGGASRFFYCAKASRSERGPDNNHPTVKPLAVMRYLVRLVTPPGGTVLDPFAGSGSTLIAALQEGFDAIGIEAESDYIDIIRGRPQWVPGAQLRPTEADRRPAA